MSPEEGQEEFEEVSQELRKREEVVGVVSTSDRKLVVFCRPQQKDWYDVLHCEIPPTVVCHWDVHDIHVCTLTPCRKVRLGRTWSKA